jgi:hypothetical protein
MQSEKIMPNAKCTQDGDGVVNNVKSEEQQICDKIHSSSACFVVSLETKPTDS